MEIQEFDFDIYHIEGEKNVVADNFSRLCANLAKEENIEEFYNIRDDDDEIEYLYLQTENEQQSNNPNSSIINK
jgi:hypothetical protein